MSGEAQQAQGSAVAVSDQMVNRAILSSELRSAGGEICHIAGQISGARAVTPDDLRRARDTMKRASAAIDRFEARL